MNVDNSKNVDTGVDTKKRVTATGLRALGGAALIGLATLAGALRLPVASASVIAPDSSASSVTCPDIVIRESINFTKKSFNAPYGRLITQQPVDMCQ